MSSEGLADCSDSERGSEGSAVLSLSSDPVKNTSHPHLSCSSLRAHAGYVLQTPGYEESSYPWRFGGCGESTTYLPDRGSSNPDTSSSDQYVDTWAVGVNASFLAGETALVQGLTYVDGSKFGEAEAEVPRKKQSDVPYIDDYDDSGLSKAGLRSQCAAASLTRGLTTCIVPACYASQKVATPDDVECLEANTEEESPSTQHGKQCSGNHRLIKEAISQLGKQCSGNAAKGGNRAPGHKATNDFEACTAEPQRPFLVERRKECQPDSGLLAVARSARPFRQETRSTPAEQKATADKGVNAAASDIAYGITAGIVSWTDTAARQQQTYIGYMDSGIFNSIRAILDEFSIERLDLSYRQLIRCGIRDGSHVEMLVKEIFERATCHHDITQSYADLCIWLHAWFEETHSAGDERGQVFKQKLRSKSKIYAEGMQTFPEHACEGTNKFLTILLDKGLVTSRKVRKCLGGTSTSRGAR